MRTSIAKTALRKLLGLYITDQEVVISRIGISFFGPIELERRTEPSTLEQLPEILERLLGPPNKRKPIRMPIAVGLPPLRVFFSTRPIQVIERDASPQVLLHEMLQSPNVNVDDMAIDVIKAKPGDRPVASIVSCRRKYLSGILSAFEPFGITPHRVEPAPCALLRVASLRHRAPRKAKTVVRVFLGDTQCLAVLVAGDLPLIWRAFDLNANEEPATIASNILSLQILAKYCGIESTPDFVMIHGRADLSAALAEESFVSRVSTRMVHHPTPGYDSATIALGLALGCQPAVEAFNLARTLRPRPSLWQIFPWGEAATQAAMLTCATLFLNSQAKSQEAALRAVRHDVAKHTWLAKAEDAKLDFEKRELTQKVEAIHKFLSSRVLWTSYTQDTAKKLPEGIVLRSFKGECELEDASNRGLAKQKKSLFLQLTAPISKSQTMPKEIDRFLDSLRANPLLKQDFPMIELGDLRWTQSSGRAKALADFTVICLPIPKKAPPPRPAAPAKKGGH